MNVYTGQKKIVQYVIVKYCIVQYNTVQYNVVQYNIVQFSIVQLHSIEAVISQAVIYLEISREDFKTIVNEKEKYEKRKEDIREIASGNELNKDEENIIRENNNN